MRAHYATSSVMLLGTVMTQEIPEPHLPVIQPSYEPDSTVWEALYDALPAVPATIEPFDAGVLYESCMTKYSDSPFDAYNVTFDDCLEPWRVCLQRDLSFPIEKVVEVSSHGLHLQAPG